METCEICGFEAKSLRGLATHKRLKHVEPENPESPPKADSTESREYICVTPCWHMQHRFRKGETASFTDAELPKDEQGNRVHFIPKDSTSIPTSMEFGPVIVNEKARPEK